MKMKKIMAFTLAGAMIFSTPVFAANSPSAKAVAESSDQGGSCC